MVIGSIILVLFFLQVQTVIANDRETANLWRAINGGNITDARRAIERGANVNAKDGIGRTALSTAIRSGNFEMVRLLIDRGADVNNRDNNDYTPLLAAVLRENIEMVRFLFDRGANFYAGRSGLAEIARRGNFELVRFLIDRGVDINDRHGDDGRTALHHAVTRGRFDIVQYLVENRININARAEDGATALSLAYDRGEMDIHDYLLANGAREFEPRQVAQQSVTPAQSTTVIVQQPSASQQTPAPTQQQADRNIGREIAEAFRSPLQSGTYALAGTQDRIRITAVARSGIITQTWQGQNFQGTYNIDGNRMTVQIRGFTFVFNITSETSFSGHGENWVRIGL